MKLTLRDVRIFGLMLAFAPLALRAEDQPAATGWETPPAQPAPASAPVADQPEVVTPSVAPNGAVGAMLAIDPKYAEGVVLVDGRGGNPEPKEWVVVARNTDDQGTLHKITVAEGQVIADVLSMNAYESFRQSVNINAQQVQVDSGQAFFIAQPIAAANQKIIGHVDYALTIRGKDATPIWTLNCFDIDGGFLGKVVLLATTGAVLETPGFKNAPAAPANPANF